MFKFKSLQSKISMVLGLVIIFLSLMENIPLSSLALQVVAIYLITKNIECMVYGNCILSSWSALLLPLLAVLIALMYKISYFEKYADKLDRFIQHVNSFNHEKKVY